MTNTYLNEVLLLCVFLRWKMAVFEEIECGDTETLSKAGYCTIPKNLSGPGPERRCKLKKMLRISLKINRNVTECVDARRTP